MTGLIYFVQIVHYPLFAEVGSTRFARYEARHMLLTTWVVAPVMLFELMSSVALLRWRPAYLNVYEAWWLLALLLFIWVSTYALQVPAHARLSQGFEPLELRRLLLSNWLRTAAWSLRALWLAGVLARGLQS